MNTAEEYQWRYRRPARSFHEGFTETMSLEARVRRRRRSRQCMVTAFLIGFGGSAVSWLPESAAAPQNTPLARAECLVQQTVSAFAKLPIFNSTDG